MTDSALHVMIDNALADLASTGPANDHTDSGTSAPETTHALSDNAEAAEAAEADVIPAPRCGDDLSEADLLRYPTRHRLPFAGSVHRAFRRCLRRLGDAFNADGTEANFRSIALLPKLTLGGFGGPGNNDALISALNNYPHIPTPPPPLRPLALSGTYAGPGNRVRRLVRQGRLGAAARALAPSPIAPPGPETDTALARLHPEGAPRPFPPANPRNPAKKIDDDALDRAFATFDSGTAAGTDGWTAPLLKNALGVAPFRDALRGVAGRMLAGNAPCRDLLCASTLTPLQKYDARGAAIGVRPIAVGSLIYRLLTKAILRTNPLRDNALLPFQLGVGTAGGVEPMLQWLQQAVDDVNDTRVLTCLDFKNAFNTVDRRLIAEGVRQRAPNLYKLARWAYDAPSPLLTRTSILRSTQGVRQGDPLGPALFSLAIANLLRDMNDALGPDYDIKAYLDDIMILGPDDALDKISAFLESRDWPLRLNLDKCVVRRVSDIRDNGIDALGGHVGPLATRRAFLNRAVDAQDTILANLDGLPKQDALLLLRACIQHNLSHLLRSVDPEGALDVWGRRDRQLVAALAAIRGPAPSEFRDILHVTYDAEICALPARHGGLGMLSHAERAPLARAAATEASLSFLGGRNGTPVPPGLSQKARHQPILEARLDALWGVLDAPRRVALLEGASYLGRRWLTVVPWSRDVVIPDEAVSAALFARALAGPLQGRNALCGRCNILAPSVGHADTCSSRNAARTYAHEVIKGAVRNALRGVPSSEATTEPEIGDSGTRNDIRLVAHSSACPLRTTEYDVTSVALSSTMHGRPALRGARADDSKGAVLGTIEDALLFQARTKWSKQLRPGEPDAPLFVPLVFSAGGIALAETTDKAIKLWRNALSDLSFEHLINVISCALLGRRAYRAPRSLRDRLSNDKDDGSLM